MIFDIGLQIVVQFVELLKILKIILWNGLVGVFEFDQFGEGICILVNVIVDSVVFFIVGGGDILVVIDKYGIVEWIFYIFIGGGVFFEFVEGKVLLVVEILEQCVKG